MFERPDFDANGKKVLCDMNGKNADMNMNIYVKRLTPGESLYICDDMNETAVLLRAASPSALTTAVRAARAEIRLRKSPMPSMSAKTPR